MFYHTYDIGHFNIDHIKHELIKFKVYESCPICSNAKLRNKPFYSSQNKASYPFEKIHMDTVQSSDISIYGNKYFLSILDEFTRYGYFSLKQNQKFSKFSKNGLIRSATFLMLISNILNRIMVSNLLITILKIFVLNTVLFIQLPSNIHLLKTEKSNVFKKLLFIMLLLCSKTPNFTINFRKMLWLLLTIYTIEFPTNLIIKHHMNYFVTRKLTLTTLKFLDENVIFLFLNNLEPNLKDLLFLEFSLDTTNLTTPHIRSMM